MKAQKHLIDNGDWDYLIVLDACRFDVFNRIYNKYFEGELEKVKSSGSSTGEWLYKTFSKEYEITYVSGNPYVNSKGKSLKECNPVYENYSWKAVNHFSDIIDAWQLKWSEKEGTVLPWAMNKLILRNHKKNNDKTIAHYMQPHLPYINFSDSGRFDKVRKAAENKASRQDKQNLKQILKVFKPLFKALPMSKKLKIKQLLGYKIPDHKKLIMERKTDRLKELYKKNLEIALHSIEKLIPKIEGKIIITSDHGEAFGEDGLWFHQLEAESPILKEVPWFEVEVINKDMSDDNFDIRDKTGQNVESEPEQKIKKKLEALGYKT